MKIRYNQKGFRFGLFLMALLLLGSCTVSRKSVYFNDLPDTAKFEWAAAKFTEPVIQVDDILSINIQTVDPTSSTALNQATSMQLLGTNTGNQQVTGFLVDKAGKVSIPMLGEIELAGLTTFQAREAVAERARVYYQNPTVQVRFANYKVSVHGEVARPGVYTVPNEKITLLDALAMAGDLTIFGKRDNVLLIRDNNGVKEFVRFNLNSATMFESPYYYLRQNDVIYVEPGKGRAASADSPRWQFYSMIASFVSLTILAISRFQ